MFRHEKTSPPPADEAAFFSQYPLINEVSGMFSPTGKMALIECSSLGKELGRYCVLHIAAPRSSSLSHLARCQHGRRSPLVVRSAVLASRAFNISFSRALVLPH